MSDNSASRLVIIGHPQGLHLRPCAEIAKAVAMYQSRVEIRNHQHTANARSVLELLLLAAPAGSQLQLRAVGPDADQAVSAVADLVASNDAISPMSHPAGRSVLALRPGEAAGRPLAVS